MSCCKSDKWDVVDGWFVVAGLGCWVWLVYLVWTKGIT